MDLTVGREMVKRPITDAGTCDDTTPQHCFTIYQQMQLSLTDSGGKENL